MIDILSRHPVISAHDGCGSPPRQSSEGLRVVIKSLFCFIAVALCGSNHALAQSPTDSAQIESGAKIYQYWCVECHNARGFGTVSLQHRYQGATPAILDQRRDLNSAFIQYVIRNGMSFMPSFRKTEITNQQLAALSAYLTGDPALRPQGQ